MTSLRILCLGRVLDRTLWTVLFCDPASCASDQQAVAAMRTIADDPVGRSDAQSISPGRRSYGPYIVDVTIAPR